MSTSASRRAQRAVDADGEDDDIIRCGEAKAQEHGGSVYGLLPSPFAESHGIEQGTPIQIAYHPPTEAFIITTSGGEDR